MRNDKKGRLDLFLRGEGILDDRSSIEKGEYICDFCNEGDSGPGIASDLFQHSVTSGH